MIGRVSIRPLQWLPCSVPPSSARGEWEVCRCIVGLYEIHTFDIAAHRGVAFLQVPNGSRMSEHPSIMDAKEAAQADFERRIMEVVE